MSTLAVVEDVLRETGVPMTVKEIVAHAGNRLPSKSKTPDTVVARDLSMDLKKRGEDSKFLRPLAGQYTLRCLGCSAPAPAVAPEAPTPVLASALRNDRAATLPARTSVGARPTRQVGSR